MSPSDAFGFEWPPVTPIRMRSNRHSIIFNTSRYAAKRQLRANTIFRCTFQGISPSLLRPIAPLFGLLPVLASSKTGRKLHLPYERHTSVEILSQNSKKQILPFQSVRN